MRQVSRSTITRYTQTARNCPNMRMSYGSERNLACAAKKALLWTLWPEATLPKYYSSS